MRKNSTVVISAVILFIIATTIVSVTDDENSTQAKFYEPKKVRISDHTVGANAEDRWLEQSEGDMESLQTQISKIQKENTDLKTTLERLNDNIIDLTKQSKDKMLMQDQIKSLEDQIDKVGDKEPVPNQYNNNKPQSLTTDPFRRVNSSAVSNRQEEQLSSIPEYRGIMSLDIREDDNLAGSNLKDIAQYIPAGSYAPAMLTSGVEASVGVSSQSDPRPVLFRVTGPAAGPLYDGEQQKIDITGCTVTGAASGDLSSEKIYVRLLKMSCARGKSKVIEIEVEGYASAVGRSGIRGPVISREGDFITKSFFAGLVSGIGGGVANKIASGGASFADGFYSSESSSADILGSGVSEGVTNSADMLSEYLINRAEQYQPVISIPAGIEVELVFHVGVSLEEQIYNHNEAENE